MRECVTADVRDVLPDLAAERLTGTDRARVVAHVAACPACAAELELLRSARRVLTRDARPVDVHRIVVALPAPPARAATAAPPSDRITAGPALVPASPGAPVAPGPQRPRLAGRPAPARRPSRPVQFVRSLAAWQIAAVAMVAAGGLSFAVLRGPGPRRATVSAPLPAAGAPTVTAGSAPAVPTATNPGAAASATAGPATSAGASPPAAGATRAEAVPADGLASSSDLSQLSDGDVESLLQSIDEIDAAPLPEPDAAVPAVSAAAAPETP